jgi:hypothetical protein
MYYVLVFLWYGISCIGEQQQWFELEAKDEKRQMRHIIQVSQIWLEFFSKQMWQTT